MPRVSELLRRRHVEVRGHDRDERLVGRRTRGTAHRLNRGKKRNTRNNLHWKTDAMGEQRIFNSADHMSIYP